MTPTCWTTEPVERFINNDLIEAARQFLRSSAQPFVATEPTADGRGWWARCQPGLSREPHAVTVRDLGDGRFAGLCGCAYGAFLSEHVVALALTFAGKPVALPEPIPLAADHEALVRACFADPADDLTRLVLADYLEEQGEGEWAAFIRLQLADPARKWDALNNLTPEERRLVLKQPGSQLNLAPINHTSEERRLVLSQPGSHLNLAGRHLRAQRGFFRSLDVGEYGPRFSDVRNLAPLFHAGMVETAVINLTRYDTGLTASALEVLGQVGELDLAQPGCRDDLLPLFAAELAPGTPGLRLRRVILAEGQRDRFAKLAANKGRHRGGSSPAGESLSLDDPQLNYLRRQVDLGTFATTQSLRLAGRLTPGVASELMRSGVPDRLTSFHVSKLELTTESVAAFASTRGPVNTVRFDEVTWGPGGAAAWLALD